MKKNKFIVVEGMEGAGKTTACQTIKKILLLKMIKNVIIVRQPGSTFISEKIRSLITSEHKKEKLNKYSELLLLYSARFQLLKNVIQPQLKKGNWIISDRHNLSSIAYQGGQGIKNSLIYDLIKITNKFAKPDLTIFFDIKQEIGLNRIILRSKLDRIEKKSSIFFSKVRKNYLKYISLNSKKIIINANLDLKMVNNHLKKKLNNWLKNSQ
ncbi:Thymidylate kinase [Buchnera aphidicola (Periphyllus testudinaceus)]|uniref:dTMP kinase n=1 Tax=Buchnera aphidicola TaxID=9 RepID=UPI003464AD25